MLAPETFEMVEIDSPTIEAMLINKQILKRMPVEKVVEILKEKVFPYIIPGEVVKVDFSVMIYFEDIKGTIEKTNRK